MLTFPFPFLGVPNAEVRLSILRVILSKTPHSLSDDDLWTVAFSEAGIIAIKRWMTAQAADPAASLGSKPESTTMDLLSSLPSVGLQRCAPCSSIQPL